MSRLPCNLRDWCSRSFTYSYPLRFLKCFPSLTSHMTRQLFDDAGKISINCSHTIFRARNKLSWASNRPNLCLGYLPYSCPFFLFVSPAYIYILLLISYMCIQPLLSPFILLFWNLVVLVHYYIFVFSLRVIFTFVSLVKIIQVGLLPSCYMFMMSCFILLYSKGCSVRALSGEYPRRQRYRWHGAH